MRREELQIEPDTRFETNSVPIIAHMVVYGSQPCLPSRQGSGCGVQHVTSGVGGGVGLGAFGTGVGAAVTRSEPATCFWPCLWWWP